MANRPHALVAVTCMAILFIAFTTGSNLQAESTGLTTVASPTVPAGVNFEVSTSAWDSVGGRPAVAHDGTNFLLVWLDSSKTVRGARITPQGDVLDPEGFTVGAGDDHPSAAFNGTDYLVVWVESSEVWGAKVGTDGSLAPGSPFAVTTGANAKSRDISLAFDDTNYLIAWRTNGDQIRAARVATSGAIVDGPAGFALGTGFYPWVAFDGTNYMVVWYYWGNGLDIFANRVATDATVLDGTGFTVSGASGDQAHASVAYGDGVYLVTWYDSRGSGGGTPNNDHDARGVRIAPDGTILDATEILIADRARHQVPVPVVFDGTDFFVVWQVDLMPADHRATDVYGRRVSTAGAVLDVEAVPASTAFHNQFMPRVGYGGGRHLVVWGEGGRCENCLWAQMLEKGAVTADSLPSAGAGGGDPASTVPSPSAVTWTTESQPTGTPLQTVLGVDGDDAFASGKDAQPLFHWDGSSWSSISYPAPNGGFGLWAAAPDDVWTIGWCYHVSRYDGNDVTNPSCLNWPDPGLGLGIWQLPSGVLLAVGSPADAKYYDGPTDWWGPWDPVPMEMAVDLHDIWATPAQRVFSVGELGAVLEWDGVEWLKVPAVPTVQTLNALWGLDDGSLFVVGDFGAILHYDGNAWTTQSSGTTEHLFDVWGVDDSEVYAVGLGGTILRYDGLSWSPESSGTDRMLLGVTRAGDQMLAVGDNGVVRSRPIQPYAALSDLAITKTDGVTAAFPGDTVTYEVRVSNLTAGAGLMAATVIDTPPGELTCTWTCTPGGGATCTRGPWTGDLSDRIELPEAATALYTGECVLDAAATGPLVNTATVAAPAGVVDPDPTNNSASDPLAILLFVDGFESGDTLAWSMTIP